ncbi:hypothetical protein IFR05_015838, partial [Cadophora sp. M221]
MKTYQKIDLNESPIIVLNCGHFFTAETLDGMVGMADAYEVDGNGEFKSLNISPEFSGAVPKCPNCNCPVRQYATQRYNRVLNRAVIDEMSKRFLVSGQESLQMLENEIEELDQNLETSRDRILEALQQASKYHSGKLTLAKAMEIQNILKDNNRLASKTERSIKDFQRKTADKNQPAQKLYEATVNATRVDSIEDHVASLNIDPNIRDLPRDRRVTFGGRAAALRARYVILSDILAITQALRTNASMSTIKISSGNAGQEALDFLRLCKDFINKIKFSNEARTAVKNGGGNARALRIKRRDALATAYPFIVATIGFCDAFIYRKGILCYTLDDRVRILDLHRSAQEELVVSIPGLLTE